MLLSARPALALLLALPALASAADPRPAERGYPLLRRYGPDEHHAGTQNFSLAQDPAGILYVGNLQGVLVHDGAWWQTIHLPNESGAYALASDAQGRVAVGGTGELGLLVADANGTLGYRSLVPELPAERRSFGDVWGIEPTASGFAFVTDQGLLHWDGKAIRSVAEFSHPEDNPPTLSAADGRVYLWNTDGLHVFDGTRLVLAPGGERFRSRRVRAVLPAGDGRLLLALREEGLRLWNGGTDTPFAPDASAWLKRFHPSACTRLADGRYAIGTSGGGVLLLAAQGQLERIIDAASGLPDARVHGVLAHRDGSVWLALDNGVVRVETASPVSVFDARAGLEGSVDSVVRHAGRLWVSTSAGLYVLGGATPPAGAPRVAASTLMRVPGLDSGGELLTFEDPLKPGAGELLVGTPAGIYYGGSGGLTLIPGSKEVTVYALARSSRDASRVWVGTRTGIVRLRHEAASANGRHEAASANGRHEAGGWRLERPLSEPLRYVSSIVERPDGTLWCGTQFDGVVRVAVAAEPFRVLSHGEGEVGLFPVAGRVLAARQAIAGVRGQEVLLLDDTTGQLRPDPGFAALSGQDVFYMAEDASGNVWLNTIPPRIALRGTDGRYASHLLTAAAIPASDIQRLTAEPDGVVWVSSERGLYRYAGDLSELKLPPPRPLLRRVSLPGGQVLFGGDPSRARNVPLLPYRFGRVRLEFAPGWFQPGVRYQYRLDPVDEAWSAWSAEPFTEFTRLDEGRYTFRVRTLGPAAEPGPETVWSFQVATPWYRSAVAWVVWVGLLAGAASSYAHLRLRSLQRHAERLEREVAERTREIERKNQQLEEANVQLESLSLHDELTGLWNRRHFERTLHEEWNRARRYRHPLSLVLMDIDHFKRLNDRYGHSRGDECLRRLGRYLGDEVQRSGELMARYGGEEFALLLPNSDAAAAAAFAERLREGISGLQILHAVSDQGHITASFGAASLVPGETGAPEELVDAADRALYQAKSEGRNCVRVAAAEG